MFHGGNNYSPCEFLVYRDRCIYLDLILFCVLVWSFLPSYELIHFIIKIYIYLDRVFIHVKYFFFRTNTKYPPYITRNIYKGTINWYYYITRNIYKGTINWYYYITRNIYKCTINWYY